MTKRTCSTCLELKPKDQFGLNGRHTYSVCKACKKLREAARKYGITTEQAQSMYSQTNCMCCDDLFDKQHLKHIHHTSEGCKGIVCQTCNHILHQETQIDLDRIVACLKFISEPRKNLFNRDNTQGSLSDPSTITRRAQSDCEAFKRCNKCFRLLHQSAFSETGKWSRNTCKHCNVCSLQARVYNLTFEEVYELRQRTVCDCCKVAFTKKNFAAIHHVEDRVLGLVCDACNRCLGQETSEQIHKLASCESWIRLMMI